MKANYHTHTWRCMHAVGTEREYVESAIESGLKILGFSDHTPYPYPKEYISGMRMRTDQLEDYVDTILNLKAEYRKDIQIHLGLEVEYYTDYFASLRRLVSDYPVEYFLLGQHCVGCEIGGDWSGKPTDDPKALRDYCEQTSEAMETGFFTYFAHPDLKIAGEEDCKVLLGIDAHNPESFKHPDIVRAAEGIVKRNGLKLQETVEFRKLSK